MHIFNFYHIEVFKLHSLLVLKTNKSQQIKFKTCFFSILSFPDQLDILALSHTWAAEQTSDWFPLFLSHGQVQFECFMSCDSAFAILYSYEKIQTKLFSTENQSYVVFTYQKFGKINFNA